MTPANKLFNVVANFSFKNQFAILNFNFTKK